VQYSRGKFVAIMKLLFVCGLCIFVAVSAFEESASDAEDVKDVLGFRRMTGDTEVAEDAQKIKQQCFRDYRRCRKSSKQSHKKNVICQKKARKCVKEAKASDVEKMKVWNAKDAKNAKDAENAEGAKDAEVVENAEVAENIKDVEIAEVAEDAKKTKQQCFRDYRRCRKSSKQSHKKNVICQNTVRKCVKAAKTA